MKIANPLPSDRTTMTCRHRGDTQVSRPNRSCPNIINYDPKKYLKEVTYNIELLLGRPSIPEDREYSLVGSLDDGSFLAYVVSGAWPSGAESLTLGFIGEETTDGCRPCPMSKAVITRPKSIQIPEFIV